MNIHTTKLELVQLLLNTREKKVLQRIKDILIEEEDFWDELGLEDHLAINEGLEQLDKGKHITHQSVRESLKNQFNFD